MIRPVAQVTVYRGTSRAGTITRTVAGSVFSYDPDFETSDRVGGVAFTLPKASGAYDTRGVNLHPFFAGLLPEGARMRALVRRVKTSEDDLLSLLAAAGPSTVGDVWVATGEGPPKTAPPPTLDLGRLDTVSFRELFERSLRGAGTTAGEAHPVPGIHDKISGGMITLPVAGSGSGRRSGAYILKLQRPDLPRLVENEWAFMTVAPRLGIPAAKVEVVTDRNGDKALLVKRFDRVPSANELLRVHQEDACQLLGRYPADKYQLTLREVAAALSICDAPIVARAALVRLYAYSYLIANGDLHAKNISVWLSPKTGLVELTPAYDLLSTLPYKDQTMAIPVDGRDAKISGRHLIDFASRIGVRAKATRRILDELCDGLPMLLEAVDDIGLEDKGRSFLKRTCKARRDDLGRH